MTKHLVTFVVVFAACFAAFWAFNTYQTQKYKSVAYLTEGVQFGVAFKGPVAAYFQDNGRFPNNNAEASLGPADQHQGQSVRSVSIEKGGRITVTYNEKSGVAGGVLYLIPAAPHGINGPISWSCISPSFPNIALALPTCTHGSIAK